MSAPGEEPAAERRVGHDADAELARGRARSRPRCRASTATTRSAARRSGAPRRGAHRVGADLGQARGGAPCPRATSSAIAPTVSSIGTSGSTAVQVVEVDVVDAEAPQRLVAAPARTYSGRPSMPSAGRRRRARCRTSWRARLVAAAGDGAPDELLVGAGAVHVGGVEEGHAELERAVDGARSTPPRRRAVELGHAHAAEAEGGRREGGEVALLQHGWTYRFRLPGNSLRKLRSSPSATRVRSESFQSDTFLIVELEQRLRDAGLRVTGPRAWRCSRVLSEADDHPRVDQVIERVRAAG